MEIGLLGSLEVFDDDGKSLPLAGARLQSLLTVLALRTGEVVTDDQLVEALWGGDPPRRSANALQRQVSTLRRTLGAPELVERRGGGYALNVDRSAIDVFRFDALVAAARDAMEMGDSVRAGALLGDGLRLWRGDALVHVAYEEFAQPEIARLTEARLAATELSIDALLAAGQDAGLVGELERLVATYPLREHLRAQLMLALSRSGRPAEALRAFQDARALLGEELGLEPSGELRELEAAIIAQEAGVVRRTVDVVPRPTTNLRAPLNTLIGRRAELDALRPRLREHRLLTLIGPGGVGKSRLVLDAAREWRAAGEFEVWMVELGDVSDAADIVPAIMTALELPRAGPVEADHRRLVAYLRDRRALLVLDNCEHLVAAAARLAQNLLESCPSARIWATSREGLAVTGEVLWPVPPLSLDDAVALFVERGAASDPSFALSARDIEPVLKDICVRLDGLPLAIELAAARLRVMPIAELAAGLEDRFRILNRGARTALPRQQTLRAVVDWSYDLLFDDERKVFDRLSVFRGSCALAAARVVCADDDISAEDVAELVARLVDKSLVVIEPDEVEGYARCRMLQTLVEYGRDRLEDSGDAARMYVAHVRYYADFARRSVTALLGVKQRGWLRAVTANLVNLHAALDGAIADGDAETAHTISGCLGWYWWFTGRIPEGSEWLALARSCEGPVDDVTRARVLAWTAFVGAPGFVGWAGSEGTRPRDDARPDVDDLVALGREASERFAASPGGAPELAGIEMALSVTASTIGDFARARYLLVAARSRLASAAGPVAPAMRAFVEGRLAFVEDRFADADTAFRTSSELFAEHDVEVYQSFALRYAARLAARRGDAADAIAAVETALDIARNLGLYGFANTLRADLGDALGAAGEFTQARTVLHQALTAAREVGSSRGLCESLTALAVLEWRAGDADGVERFADEGLDLARRIDHAEAATYCLSLLGFAAARRGRTGDARERFTEAIQIAEGAASRRGIAFALEGRATLSLAEGEANKAARALGVASVHRRARGRAAGPAFAANTRVDSQRLLDAAASVLGRAAAEGAFEAGVADVEAITSSLH